MVSTSRRELQRPSRKQEVCYFTHGYHRCQIRPKVERQLWSRGVQGVENRLRLRISRKRNDEEEAKEKLFAFVEFVSVPTAKGLQTVVVDEDEA